MECDKRFSIACADQFLKPLLCNICVSRIKIYGNVAGTKKAKQCYLVAYCFKFSAIR